MARHEFRRLGSRASDSSPSLSLASFASLSSLSFDVASDGHHDNEALSDDTDEDNVALQMGSSSDGEAADDELQQRRVEREKEEQEKAQSFSRVRRRNSGRANSRSSPRRSWRSVEALEAPLVAPHRPSSSHDAERSAHSRQTRQLHFHALFVRVDPPLLRGLRHLELSAQNLKRTELQTLAAHLFLLEALVSISLADNQLEDSCVKELRAVLCLESLERVDLSKNLLGRGTAKMVADRLKHRLALRSLDVSGNPQFFAFDDAHEIARGLAQGLAANLTIANFRVSLPVPQPHLEHDRLILPQAASSHSQLDKPGPGTSQRLRGRSFAPTGRTSSGVSDHDREATPAETFTRELVELQAGAGQTGGLYSLGLVHAELSRRSIVNLMKLASRLVALDLSFAFAGIPAAQVIASALKMKDYATLTQLNLRGNRLKTMGARAICRALHANARLTDLNLSRNELRSELVPDLSAMLCGNHTLVRLDLTQNDELLSELKETSATWQVFVGALHTHTALRSLGDLERLAVETSAHRHALQRVLDRHQQRSDERVLVGVHESMAFEAGGGNTNSELGPVVTVTLSMTQQQQYRSEKTVWKQRREIAKQARVSVKWKMMAFVPAAPYTGADKKGRPAAPPPSQRAALSPIQRVHWRVVVHRKCDIAGAVEYDAAQGALVVSPSASSGTFALCSALVYCDERDGLSIAVSIGIEDEDGEAAPKDGSAQSTVKVLAKEFVVLPHPLTLRHISFYYDASESHPALPSVEWLPKRVRNPEMDVFPYTAELAQAYIARTATYRLVWRIRVDSIPQTTTTDGKAQYNPLDGPWLWQVQRSHCWAPDDAIAILEGSGRELRATVRNQRELVVCTPPLVFVAGELVHLRVQTQAVDVALALLQWFVLDETVTWENAPPPSLLSTT